MEAALLNQDRADLVTQKYKQDTIISYRLDFTDYNLLFTDSSPEVLI